MSWETAPLFVCNDGAKLAVVVLIAMLSRQTPQIAATKSKYCRRNECIGGFARIIGLLGATLPVRNGVTDT